MVSSPDNLRAQGEGPALLRITSRQAGRREKLTNTPKGLILRTAGKKKELLVEHIWEGE